MPGSRSLVHRRFDRTMLSRWHRRHTVKPVYSPSTLAPPEQRKSFDSREPAKNQDAFRRSEILSRAKHSFTVDAISNSEDRFEDSQISHEGMDYKNDSLSDNWINYNAFFTEFFERSDLSIFRRRFSSMRKNTLTMPSLPVEEPPSDQAISDQFTKIFDPHSFFAAWNGSEGVRACIRWFDESPGKIGNRMSDKTIIKLLGNITYLDAIKIHDIVNAFEPDGYPSMTCIQFHVLISCILAREEGRLGQFVYLHSDWVYNFFNKSPNFTMERALALIRALGVPEDHIMSILSRLSISFNTTATVKMLTLSYFFILNEWEVYRNGQTLEVLLEQRGQQ